MKTHELMELSKDRELVTNEVYTPNDFYGHASVIKRYCGIDHRYPIKAAIEHAPTFGNLAWSSDLAAQFPSIFSFSSARFPILRNQTRKSLFAIGAPILYAEPLLSQEETTALKSKLGNNLLVFPSHSSHHIDVKYDIVSYCKKIRALEAEFDSIRVCLYWKDVLEGKAKFYQDQGFECVTAGHMFDPDFLRRLRSLIETSSAATGPEGGTCVGYCVALNVPFFISKTSISYDARNMEHSTQIQSEYDQSKNFYDRVLQTFSSTHSKSISLSERELVDVHWGVSSKKSPEQMRALLEITEELNAIAQATKTADFNFLPHKLPEYLKGTSTARSLLAIESLESSDPALCPDLPLARAAILFNQGDLVAARGILTNFVKLFPANETALQLLQRCS